MKKILLFYLICFSLDIFAQRVDKPGEPYDYFCNVQLGGDNDGIVYMPEDDNGKNPYVLCDSEGGVIKFNSLASVIVYMTKRGWEYVDTRYGKSLGLDIQIALLKKKITDDSEAKQFITLKHKFRSKKKNED